MLFFCRTINLPIDLRQEEWSGAGKSNVENRDTQLNRTRPEYRFLTMCVFLFLSSDKKVGYAQNVVTRTGRAAESVLGCPSWIVFLFRFVVGQSAHKHRLNSLGKNNVKKNPIYFFICLQLIQKKKMTSCFKMNTKTISSSCCEWEKKCTMLIYLEI